MSVRSIGKINESIGVILTLIVTIIVLSVTVSVVSAGNDDSIGNDSVKMTEHDPDSEVHGTANVTDTHSSLDSESSEHSSGEEEIGKELPPWTVLPFAGILLSIALFPLVAPEFWHHNFPKISAFWALLFAIPFIFAYNGLALHEIFHIYLIDYIPFILLLWALYTIAGGIVLKGTLAGKPIINTAMILIGTILASWIGTTGASMLLIRPLLRANRHRKNKVHIVVFFIFLASNIGGSLTPLGDPPLFLGFLHGVPFFWTLAIFPLMSLAAVLLLTIFFIWDTILYNKEKGNLPEANPADAEPLRLLGSYNFIFLLGVIGAVLMSGVWNAGEFTFLGVEMEIQNVVRDVLLILMGILSLKVTPTELRKDNEFTWFPILEVAYLFAGIFMTIIPALAILRAGQEGSFAPLLQAVRTPAHYFWITGGLSSFLDNAPTYLTFFNTALGRFFAGLPESEAVRELIANEEIYLKAIAAGAVFMGANTYIGNAPNFMVKSIAEESGVPMPSFFGYILKYSLPILIPVFLVIMFVFFM